MNHTCNEYYNPGVARELIVRHHKMIAMAEAFYNRGMIESGDNWYAAASSIEKRILSICERLQHFADLKPGRVQDNVNLIIKNIMSQLEA